MTQGDAHLFGWEFKSGVSDPDIDKTLTVSIVFQ